MKTKKWLLMSLLLIILIILTGCNTKEDVKNNISNIESDKNVVLEQSVKPYKWIIEPKIEADDIIDLDVRQEVSLIKKGKKYNFINNDQGKELLREDFYGYAALDNGEIDIWQEGGAPYKVNEDYSLEESDYAGDFAPSVIYYNTQRKELFTQNHMYLVINNDDKQAIENHKKMHGTALECFVEVTPISFTDDEFDRYADFYEEDLGKYGYYDKENLEIKIAPTYDKAFDFYEGVAAVKKDNKAGFIDFEGKEIFPFEFEETRSFDSGRAWVKLDGKWGVIELIK